MNAAMFTPDGRSILSGGGDGTIKVWDIRTLVPYLQIIGRFEGLFCEGCPRGFQSLSADSQRLLTFDYPPDVGVAQLRVWDVTTGSIIRRFEVDRLRFFSVDLSGNGRLLATQTGRECVVLWNVTTGEKLFRLETQGTPVFSPDDRWMLTWGWQSPAQLWDTATGQLLVTFESIDGVGFGAQFSRDGRRVLSVGDGFAVVQDTLTGTEIRRFDLDPSSLHGWPPRQPRGPRFTPDGDRLVVKGPEKGTVHVWDIGTGQEVQRIEHPLGHPFPEEDGVFFAVSPDGGRLLTGSCWHPTAHLWDIASGKELLQFEPGFQFEPGPLGQVQPYLSSVAFSPQGTLVLTAYQSGWDDGPPWYLPVILWDATTGRELRHLRAWAFDNLAEFSPDGRFVLSGSGGLGTLWDICDLIARPRFEQSANGPKIHWDLGALQFSCTVAGPWLDLPAASPFPLSTIGEKGFFRVKVDE